MTGVARLNLERSGPRIRIRLLFPTDAEPLLRFKEKNREYFRPFWPTQNPADYTLRRQTEILAAMTEHARRDHAYGFGIFDSGGRLIGTVNLNSVVRGAYHGAYLGYSMEEASTGRGLMTEAVGLVTEVAFAEIRLHRVQAAIMPHNVGSIRVVERNRYRREGFALRYLHIGGDWRDHVIYARLSDE